MDVQSSLVLVIGSDVEPARSMQQRLCSRGYMTQHAVTASAGVSLLDRAPADLIVVAPPLADQSLTSVLAQLREANPAVPVVVAGEARAIHADEALAQGAYECVADPLQHPDRLLQAVGYALGARGEDRELRYLRNKDGEGIRLESMVGGSERMREVFDFVRRICARTANGSPPTFLLTGETGTGKGALAKVIHRESVRRNRPFVEINCAALPANLVESELFGYERGAFTDAGRGRAGLFETADGGTLFLDEVASLPLELQAKLLTAIEDKRIRRIGGRDTTRVDVQLIAAAQPKRLKEGFREDLFHRLNVLSVRLPPLRDRGDDIVRLAETFVGEMCTHYGMPPLTLSESALRFVRGYHWPGNVRELRNQIERIVLLSDGETIEGWQFQSSSEFMLRAEPVEGDGGAFRLLLPPNGIDLEALEREVIRQALDRHDGNVSKTARYLSITRQTLMYRVKKHGLDA